jgi:hypothetical protein
MADLRISSLNNILNNTGKIRLLSCTGKEASAWTTTVPKTEGLAVEPSTFRSMISFRFGANLPGIRAMPCKCLDRGSRGHIDPKGLHLMALCKKGNQRFVTHNGLAHCYVQMLRQAGYITRLEVPNAFSHVANTEKRADFIVENFRDGRACFDVSVTHPWATASVTAAGQNPTAGKAACLREGEKRRKYGDLASAAGMSFHPLIHESYGRVGREASWLIQHCVERISELKHIPKPGILHYWRCRFSVLLQRLLAQAVRERFASCQAPNLPSGADECHRLDYHSISRVV